MPDSVGDTRSSGRFDIFQRLCTVRFGQSWTARTVPGAAPITRASFFSDVLKFQRRLVRLRSMTISRQAISLWRDGEGVPTRSTALRFIEEYLMYARKEAEKRGTWTKLQQAAYRSVTRFLEEGLLLGEGVYPVGLQPKASKLDPAIALVLQGAVAVSNASPQSEMIAFFRDSKRNAPDNQSYYLLYRYSTNSGEIVKTFLVIRTPMKGVRTQFTFNNFVWGGEGSAHLSHLFRECEGVILKMEKSFYFLGYNFIVPANKRLDPEIYRALRPGAKWQPNGMGVIAIEFDDIRVSPGLFGGLILTVGDMAQPVASRIALLHLGTRESLGRLVMDTDVSPGEINPEYLSSDLLRTVENMRGQGCREFGPVLREQMRRPNWNSDNLEPLARQIIAMVDNTPAWENKMELPKARPSKARGALETFGPGRPRN